MLYCKQAECFPNIGFLVNSDVVFFSKLGRTFSGAN